MAAAEQGRSNRTSGSSDDARRQLHEELAPAVASSGYDLEDVTIALVGRRRLVRVVVDADGGVDLDGIAEVSRVVSAKLEDRDDDANGSRGAPGDPFAGPYVLEVTSPGIDRPLTEPRHWRRSIGRLVQVDIDSVPSLGRVLQADDRGVVLEVDGAGREANWAALGVGHVQIEFNRADRPGED